MNTVSVLSEPKRIGKGGQRDRTEQPCRCWHPYKGADAWPRRGHVSLLVSSRYIGTGLTAGPLYSAVAPTAESGQEV